MSLPLADSEGGGGDVRPPPLKSPNKHKKTEKKEKQRERERREVQSLRLKLS